MTFWVNMTLCVNMTFWIFPFFAFIMLSHKCVTINVNGLHDSVKRQNIFETFKRLDYDIIALQETKGDKPSVALWEDEWGLQSFWSAGSKDRKGVAFLFGRNAEVEILAVHHGPSARLLRVDARINNTIFQLICIYGVTAATQTRSDVFFRELSDLLDPSYPPMLFGDFNMVDDLTMDRQGGNPRPFHRYGMDTLAALVLEPFGLVDIWRHQHPSTRQFTHHKVMEDIHSRLDRIYIPASFLDLTVSSHISHFVWSDHDVCAVNIHFRKTVNRGPGYFKLNLSYLDHPAYVEKIQAFWRSWQGQRSEFSNISDWWELGKVYVRQISIEHARIIYNHRREEKADLLAHLEREREKGDSANSTRIFVLEDRLQSLELESNKKVFHHAHVDVRELDEKPTRFFILSSPRPRKRKL